MTETTFTVEVQPRLPARLRRLEELANDLVYSWDRRVRALYARLDAELWREVGHNPKVFLRRVSQQALDEAAQDRGYLEEYSRALSGYDSYTQAHARAEVARTSIPRTIWWPISAPSTACTRACRSTPAALAFWPAITARRPATWACRSWRWGCCTGRAISRS